MGGGESPTSESDLTVPIITSPRRVAFGGHGAPREIDESFNSQRSLRSVQTINRSEPTSPHSQTSYRLAHSPKDQTRWMSLLGMKQHFDRRHVNAEVLRGKLADMPRHWLWVRFLNNSFFARRLMRSGLRLTAGILAGWLFYRAFIQPRLDTYKEDNPDHYKDCEAVVTFSTLIYETIPAAVILSLPGSGLRLFEPFRREEGFKSTDTRTRTSDDCSSREGLEEGPKATGVLKIRRCFVFQLCEVLAVFMLVFDVFLVLYFLRVVFSGSLNSCGSIASQIFVLGAAFCYADLFVVLYYFTRYREHIKMQLGAFSEGDQTGHVREHVDLSLKEKISMPKKMLSVVRTRLYHATRRGDLQEMREILEYAKAKGFMSSEYGFPRKTYAAPMIKLKLFAKSRENPVHVAAYHGNIRALELLEEYDFDMKSLDKFRRVIFSTGGFFWHFIQLIVRRPDGSDEDTAVSIFHSTLVTPLHCAVSTGQHETVRWLLERGAPPGTLAQASFRSNRVPPLFLAEH
ncbi:hypothetical protein BBJ29_009665, partial [Phytophthora kernoviae]